MARSRVTEPVSLTAMQMMRNPQLFASVKPPLLEDPDGQKLPN
jgi:hypothetical protein